MRQVELSPSVQSDRTRVCPLLDDCVAKLFATLRTSNNRIRLKDFLNQCCALVSVLESILLILVVKIVLQHNRTKADKAGFWAAMVCSLMTHSGQGVDVPRLPLCDIHPGTTELVVRCASRYHRPPRRTSRIITSSNMAPVSY